MPRPSYVLGMLVLYKHIDISASDRMMNAFNRMDKVKFSGDVHEYQIECHGTGMKKGLRRLGIRNFFYGPNEKPR